jgi:uncharacterized coiled-coil DUF342 family protein
MYYVVSMVLLMATLFWALWDEAYGQRPWKTFQNEWKQRYSAFLDKTRPASDKSVKSVEDNPEYQKLLQAFQQADAAAKPRRDELQKQILDISAKILAVQNVFTDKRAYANSLNYQIETETSASGKASKQRELNEYKNKLWTVEFPDGHKEKYNFRQLEEKYNELKDLRTNVNAQLGDVLKPVTVASTKLSAYLSANMVDLTPTQIEGLQKKTTEWDPKIVQINVADANIVDRCESCHMGIREPLKITPAAMTAKGEKKPD